MFARERLMPAPGRACCRSAYFGGAIRVSTRRGTSDWTSVVSRRTAAVALRWRRLACGDMAPGLLRRLALADRGDERFMGSLRESSGPRSDGSASTSGHSATLCIVQYAKCRLKQAVA